MSLPRLWILDARICWMVLIAFSFLSLVPANGNTALIGSRLADGTFGAERQAQIEMIRQALEQQVVAQRLSDFGLSPEEVSAKLPTMSDEQLHQLAGLSKDVAAGSVLEAVIAVLLIVFLVVVIMKLMDREIVIR
ncbi:PA2779 family protein [Desulfuromonas sp. TF]|uniref:PA2779 family protein n=1 Tax=Desulfuromonas sp. TF TaxID=1232410 RepID=UPI000407E062|nr:PA2779 family protein [Desulfuromonas sp. TF]